MMTPLSPSSIAEAASLLMKGCVVVLPTDTVYGIAAHPGKPEAVARICTIKGRPTGKPIALLASEPEAVEHFGARVPEVAKRLAARYWPGALTLVLPCGEGFEGFRVPAHEGARADLRQSQLGTGGAREFIVKDSAKGGVRIQTADGQRLDRSASAIYDYRISKRYIPWSRGHVQLSSVDRHDAGSQGVIRDDETPCFDRGAAAIAVGATERQRPRR